MISVLIPTRGRDERLRRTVAVLMDKAEDPSRVEILLRVDEDDPAAYEPGAIPWRVVRGPRGRGYRDLHLFYDELARVAAGQWLYIYGDDVTMQTPGWDRIIAGAPPRTVLMCGRNEAPGEFPVVHRDLHRALGRFALNAHVDSWWVDVANACGIAQAPGVFLGHDLPSNPDPDTLAYHSREMEAARAADIRVLRRLLGR